MPVREIQSTSTLDQVITIGNTLALAVTTTTSGTAADDADLELQLRAPDGTAITLTQPVDVKHDGLGQYHVDYMPSITGRWTWRWQGSTQIDGAVEGNFAVASIFEAPVTDVRDLRVLIPATRRAIDGPTATSADAPSATLTDEEILGLVADATANLILLTHGNEAFGYELQVVARDPFYMAPNAWQTDKPRVLAVDAAIATQAALDYYFEKLKLLKVSEGIKDEGQEWTYTLSANLLRDQMAYLIANRDKAIESLQAIHVPLDTYVSSVAERDRMAAAWLEPWVTEIGAPVPYAGGGGSGPLEYDYRFATWG